MILHSINKKQLVVGGLALAIGFCIYLFDRNPHTVLAIYQLDIRSFYSPERTRIFGTLGGNLPSFIHVFSFSLITCALLPNKNNIVYLYICVIWFFVNFFFEFSQILQPGTISEYYFDNVYLEPVIKYSQYGTFDYMDVVFMLLGLIFSYVTIRMTVE